MSATQCPECKLWHVGHSPCDVPRLREAFRGVKLTEQDERFLRHLAGGDRLETDQLIWLVDRLRGALLSPSGGQ